MNEKEFTSKFFNQLVRQHVTGESIKFSAQQLTHVDKNCLLYLLTEHKLKATLAPLLLECFSQDQELQQQLLEYRTQAALRYFAMMNSLLAITQLFTEHHIHYVVLKGLPLNHQLYGNQYARTVRDIDILIQPKDVLSAHRCLIDAGYQMDTVISPEQLTPENFKFLLEYTKDLPYWHPKQKVLDELHWKTTRTTEVGLEQLNAKQITAYPLMANQSVDIFKPEYNFLYLCFHAVSHSWVRLQWLVDLALFYQKIPLDWENLIKLAKKYHCLRPLLQAKALMEQRFGMKLPEVPCQSKDRLAVKIHLRYINKALDSLWRFEKTKAKPNLYTRIFYYTLIFPKLKYKAAYLFGLFWHRPYALAQLQHKPKRNKLTVIALSITRKFLRFIKR